MRNATFTELCQAVKSVKEGRGNDAAQTLAGTVEGQWSVERIRQSLFDRYVPIRELLDTYDDATAPVEQPTETPNLNDYVVGLSEFVAPSITGTQPAPLPPLMEPVPTESKIVVGPGTPLACTCCHRMGMALYYMKRSNGKYDVLCFDNGKGCWEHSARGLCTFVDEDGAQCTDLAEWVVIYGEETDLQKRAVCSRHIAGVLSGSRAYRIYPIDNDLLGGASFTPRVEPTYPRL